MTRIYTAKIHQTLAGQYERASKIIGRYQNKLAYCFYCIYWLYEYLSM